MTTGAKARAGLFSVLALLAAPAASDAQTSLPQPKMSLTGPNAASAGQTAAPRVLPQQIQPAFPAAGAPAPKAQAATAPRRPASERECLARAMYFESEKSAEDGMLAVGTVVANRLKSGRYGSSYCGVVGQPGQFAPGVLSRSMTGAAAERARQMADAVLKGRRHPSAGQAMFFHVANMRFRYPNMHYVLVSGGNAFYEKRRGATPFDSMAKAVASARRDEALAEPVVQAALASAPEAPRAETPLAYGGAAAPAAGTALAAVAAIRPKKTPRVVTPSEPVLASIGPVAPLHRAPDPGRYAYEPAGEANEMVAVAWAPFW